jgi:membrane protein insertase Oxa1/YidC/SpoIIIJ
MQVDAITNQAYNGAVVGLYSITRSAQTSGAPSYNLLCSYTVRVDQDNNEVEVAVDVGDEENSDDPEIIPFTVCGQLEEDTPAFAACDTCDTNDGLWTAVGCISTNPGQTIAALVKIGINIGGGVALLMILAAGFMFTTSQGDPNKTKEAKDLMQAAVIGLLFIIFSVTILQFIGVSILQIPGFGGN